MARRRDPEQSWTGLSRDGNALTLCVTGRKPCCHGLADVLSWVLLRSVAQPGSASDWGSEGRGFESRRSDHKRHFCRASCKTLDLSGISLNRAVVQGFRSGTWRRFSSPSKVFKPLPVEEAPPFLAFGPVHCLATVSRGLSRRLPRRSGRCWRITSISSMSSGSSRRSRPNAAGPQGTGVRIHREVDPRPDRQGEGRCDGRAAGRVGLGLERDDLFAGVPRVFRKPPCGTPARGLFEGRAGRGAGRQTSAAESGDPPGPVVRLDPVAGQRSPVHGLHPRGRVLFARLDEEDGPGLRRAEIRGPVHRAPERTEMRAVRAFWPRPAGRRTSRRCRLPGPQEPPGRIDAPVTVIRNLTCAPRRATLVSHANPGTGSSAEQKAHGNPRSILAGADVCIRCGLAGLLHGFRRNRQMACSHSRRMNVRRSPGPRPSPAAVEPVHEQPRQTDRQIENRSAPVPVARRVKIARRFRLGLECRSTFSTGVTLDERVPSNTPAHDHVPGGETADCPRIWLRSLVAL